MLKKIFTLLAIAMLSFAYCNAREYCTVADDILSLRAKPGNHTKITHRVGKTAKLEYIDHQGFWAKVVFKGDTCYAQLNSLSFSNDVKATLPAWVNLDETHGKWGSLGYYFSTDRIMETLPDFNILKDKTIIPPDKCFWIAFWILLVVTVSFLFLKRNIRFGNIWFWIYYCATMALSIFELMYVFGSPDPLGFCDVNNVWWPKAWIYIFLIAIALFQQIGVMTYILFVIQADRDFDYKAGWWVKLPFLGVLYFIIWVVGYYFDFEYPITAHIIAAAVLSLPLIFMLGRSIINLDIVSFLVAAPFYLIVSAAILALYCLVGIAFAVLAFLTIVVMLCGDSKIYGKIGGQWYEMNYEYFDLHRNEITDSFTITPLDELFGSDR